jgi:tRNA threonylcarbamoyladenosine biosynthesis protein TsaE
MTRFEFRARNLADTDKLGAHLAALPDGTTLALRGTLGSGKTRLVQAIAAACDVPRETVLSPTFVLCHEYRGRRTIYHLDAYRLKNEAEFWQLGPEEYFASPALTLIEWADRVEACLPAERIDVRIQLLEETTRCFEITARGERLEAALAQIAQDVGSARDGGW